MHDINILVLNHLWLHNALFKPYISLLDFLQIESVDPYNYTQLKSKELIQ